MKKLLIALTALPLTTGLAVAQPQRLSDTQMDRVSAGAFSAIAKADAEGLAGVLQTLLTTTAVLSQVSVVATATQGGITSTLFQALSSSHSSSVTAPLP